MSARRATLYIEHSVLTFPGTASFEWRSEISSVFDRARVWFPLSVVLVGRDRLDLLMHQALHELGADRAAFGGVHSPHVAYMAAVAADRRSYPTDQIWLLSTTLNGSYPTHTRDAIDKLALHAQVRVLPVRSDVVTPLVADDLEEVLGSFARRSEER